MYIIMVMPPPFIFLLCLPRTQHRWLADAIALHEAATEATAAAAEDDATGDEAPWVEADRRKLAAAAAGARGGVPTGVVAGARASAAVTNGDRAATGGGGGGGGGSRLLPIKKTGGVEQEDAELSYRAKYTEALDALAAASGSLSTQSQAGRASADGAEGPPGAPGVAGIVRTRDGSRGGGGAATALAEPGEEAPTGKKLRYILDSYRWVAIGGSEGIGRSTVPPPAKGGTYGVRWPRIDQCEKQGRSLLARPAGSKNTVARC